MNRDRINRAFIDSLLTRFLIDFENNPQRSLRYIDDLAQLFADTPARFTLLDEVHRQINRSDTPCIESFHQLLRHVDHSIVRSFSLTLGFDCCVVRARTILEYAKQTGRHIPFALSIHFGPKSRFDEALLFDLEGFWQRMQGYPIGLGLIHVQSEDPALLHALLDFCHKFPDNVFILFVEAEPLLSIGIEALGGQKNVMFSLGDRASLIPDNRCQDDLIATSEAGQTDSPFVRATARLIHSRCLYSHHLRYDNPLIADYIISGEWLEQIIPIQGVFAILIPENFCDPKTLRAVHEYSLWARIQQPQKLLPFDYVGDFVYINQSISGQDCSLDLDPFGSLTARGIEDDINAEIQVDWRDIAALDKLFPGL